MLGEERYVGCFFLLICCWVISCWIFISLHFNSKEFRVSFFLVKCGVLLNHSTIEREEKLVCKGVLLKVYWRVQGADVDETFIFVGFILPKT